MPVASRTILVALCTSIVACFVPGAAAAATGSISTVAGTGTAGFSGDGAAATSSRLNVPVGVRATVDGGYLIADQANNRVRKVSASGAITTVAGSSTAGGFGGDGGPATSAQLDAPSGAAQLPDGSVLLADANNDRVRRVSPSGTITTVVGGGSALGDNGPATSADLSFPYDVEPTADGGYLVADVDNNRIRKVSAGGTITTVAGGGGSLGDGGPATSAALYKPSAVAVLSDGGFLIADTYNGRIRRVSATGVITTVAGGGGAATDGGQATAASLAHPARVAVLPDGSFVIAEQGAHRIRRVTNGIISTVAGTGSAGAGGDGGAASSAQMNTPTGVTVAADGDVLVADTFNHRIRRIDLGDAPAPTPAPTPTPSPTPDPPDSRTWRPVGIGPGADGSLNNGPRLIGDVSATTLGNAPAVAWVEGDTGGPGREPDRVAVSLFSGRLFGTGTWNRLGPGYLPVSPDGAASRVSPVIATVGASTPGAVPKAYVAMLQRVGSATQVRVYRWDGDAWREPTTPAPTAEIPDPVGNPNPINVSPTRDATKVDIADIGGVPHVAWIEATSTAAQLHVKRFDGTSWVELGGGATPLNVDPSKDARDPDLADIGGVPYVAYSQIAQPSSPGVQITGTVQVRRFEAAGNRWSTVGTGPIPLNRFRSGDAPTELAGEPSLGSLSGVPYVVWQETHPGADNREIWAARFGGSTWESLGRVDPASGAALPGNSAAPSLAMVDGVPYVAWREEDTNRDFDVFVRRYETGAWRGAFTPINTQTDQLGAGAPTLQDVDGVPVVAFSDNTRARQSVRVLALGDPPSNLARPNLVGVPMVGRALSCGPGAWDARASFTYLWDHAPRNTRDDDDPTWAAIDGAVGQTYSLRETDAGSRIRCRVIARRAVLGARSAVSVSKRVDAGIPVNVTPPTVKGKNVFSLLEDIVCDPGEWTNGPDLSYRWYRDGVLIPNEIGPTRQSRSILDRVPLDRITCQVGALNDVGSAEPITSAPLLIYGRQPDALGPARITSLGSTRGISHRLLCVSGAWEREVGPRTYTWLRNGAAIAGATTDTYDTVIEDLGKKVRCEIGTANPWGTALPMSSDEFLVPLPPGTQGGSAIHSGGRSELDPYNMLAISSDYEAATQRLANARIKAVVVDQTKQCVARRRDGATAVKDPEAVRFPLTDTTFCQVLVQFPERVIITPTAVRFRQTPDVGATSAPCMVPGEPETFTLPGGDRAPRFPCQFIDVPMPPAGTNTPAIDAQFRDEVEPLTPTSVIWDVNDDGTTDAVCPGTAPVLRSLLGKGHWTARALIATKTSAVTGIFAGGTMEIYSGGEKSARGRLRSAQPFICRTALDPPADPELGACVTDATIGRVQISKANLCPISVRAISAVQLRELFPSTTSPDYLTLKAIAEGLDLGPGVSANGGRLKRFVDPPEELFSAGARPLDVVDDATKAAYDTAANTRAGLASITYDVAEPKKYVDDLSGMINRTPAKIAEVVAKTPSLNNAKPAFALDQIYLAKGDLSINGVTVDPTGSIPLMVPSDVREALNGPKTMKLLVSKADQYLGDKIKGLPLASGKPLSATLQDAPTGTATLLADQLDLDAVKKDLLDAARKLDFGPFKLTGADADVKLEKDGTATLTASANVPVLTDMAGQPFKIKIVLKGDREGNVKLQGLTLRVDKGVKLGPLELKGLFLQFDGGFEIRGQFLLPPTGEGIAIQRFRIDEKGRFKALDVDYVAGAGSGIPIAPPLPMYLTRLGGGVNPLGPPETKIGGSAVVAVGPSTGGGCAVADVSTRLDLYFGGTPSFVAKADGDVRLQCLKVGKLAFYVDSTGLVKLDGSMGIDAGPLEIKGAIGARVRLPKWQASVGASIKLEDLPIVGDVGPQQANFVISNVGMAACVSVDLIFDDFSGGLSVKFPGGRPPLSVVEFLANLRAFLGCDLSAFKPLGDVATGARLAAGGATTAFTLPKDGGTSILSIEGAGAAPHVKVISPSGKVFDFTNATTAVKAPDHAGQIREQEDRTVVALKAPEGGRWTIETAPGTTDVVRVQRAGVLPKPTVKVKASGKGATRRLRYEIGKIDGQEVRFSERSTSGLRFIGSVKRGGRGTLRYLTSEDATRRRTVVADVIQDDVPRVTLTVAKYSAPAPTIGTPKVKVRRSGSGVTVSWTKAALAARYDVIVVGANSGTHGDSTPGRTRRLKVGGITKGEALRVTVFATSAGGRRGKATIVKDAGSEKPLKMTKKKTRAKR